MSIKTRTSGIMVNINVEPAAVAGWQGVTSGLTHHWPMDDANVSGDTIIDIVGGLNGTRNGAGVTSAVGPPGTAGTARQFDGVNVVTLPSPPIADLQGADYSFCIWLYNFDVTSFGSDGDEACFMNFTDGTESLGIFSIKGAAPAKLEAGATLGGGINDNYANAINSQTWTMFSGAILATEGPADPNLLYVDSTVNGNNGAAQAGSTLGSLFGGRSVGVRRVLSGSRVGRVLTYNRKLSGAEILQNFNAK